MSLAIVILAAGKGTRMRSGKAKVLHEIAGKPLLQHVVDTATHLSPAQIIVVVGHQAETVTASLNHPLVEWVEQKEQLGTGDALKSALPLIRTDSILVLYGDVPLISEPTLHQVLDGIENGTLNLLTVTLPDPKGYGRIVRNNNGQVQCIVEDSEASAEIKKIREGNSGILAGMTADLSRYIEQLNSDNAQGEFYLTDCIEHCVASGGSVNGIMTTDVDEVSGINSKPQLQQLERVFQRRAAEKLMEQGVTLADASRFDLRGELQTGEDCFIDINCLFIGKNSLGAEVNIGANSVIINSILEDGITILPNTIIENAKIGRDSVIGPFARIRPETTLEQNTKVGNFVELKKATVGNNSKVNHLSYVGDAVIGENVNVGAGTITCNYDGANKHITTIENGAFIGSNTALVAPITVGENATVGAGSTLSKNAAAKTLTLTRAKQISLENWNRPIKEK